MLAEKSSLIEEYEINPYTMAIIPTQYGSRMYTEVLEAQDRFISPFRPIDIVKKSCEYFGASYLGRKEGTKRLIGITHKAPIIVDPHTSIYLFPTTSPKNPHCIWISHDHVINQKRASSNSTVVTFRNKQTLTIPVSISSFENQLYRTSLLRIRFNQHIQHMEKRIGQTQSFIMQLEASERKQNYEMKNDPIL
ncbi:competence protein ComK [Heyndrickxia camelliae]|uniref:competence protein ComK n=1 Tax=Heyndrickxia camelliae TaxID=1707093 RepID=UPI001E5E4717|nr:competence protein ComK [Heyndrickxia camelliae]